MSHPSDNKRIAKNTAFLYIRMFILTLVAFYTTRVVLRVLGIDDFGLYNVVAGFVAMVAFINQSLTNSIQRFLNVEIGKGNSGSLNDYFGVALLSQLVIGGVLLVFAESAGLWFVNTKMNIPIDAKTAANVIYQTSIFSVIIKILQSPYSALIIAKEKMQFYAVLSLIEGFGQLGVAYILLILSDHRLELYGILLLLLSFGVLIINIIYCHKLVPALRVRPLYRKDYFNTLMSFCGWNLFGASSGVMKSQGINVLINLFFGVAVNAARGISFQVLSGVSRFASNFQVAMYPQIVQSYAQGEMNRYFQLSYTCSKISLYLMWILALPLIVCINLILRIWLGNEIPNLTAEFVQIVLLTGIIDSLGAAIAPQIYATGNIKMYQIIVSGIILLILPISWLLYHLGFGATAAFWVSLALSAVAQIARVVIWSRLVNTSPFIYLRKIAIPGAFVIILSYLLTKGMWQILPHSLLYFFITALFSLFVNILLVYSIGLQRQERKLIFGIIKTKIFKIH